MKRLLGIVLIGILAACQQQAPAPSPAQIVPQVWIDAPLAGSSLELGPIQVLAHGYHPLGLSVIELSVNGAVVGSQQPTMRGSQFGYASFNWQASEATAYRLAVRTQSSQGQWSDVAIAEVAVSQNNTLSIAALPSATSLPTATITPTATPTSSPTLTAIPTRPVASATIQPSPTRVRPSNTPVRPTNLPAIPPTDTPIPPTDTPIPPTDTPVPPTATDTPAPPTATDTPVPILPPVFGEPSASTNEFTNVAGCAYPDSVSISVSVANFPAGDVSLYYHAGPSRWQSTVMQPDGRGNWNRTIRGAREMSGQRYGGFEYYILAQGSDGQSAQTQIYGGIEFLPCKP
ncbi:hypothetical protein [Herpetosiphon geysericola]|uniref:Uncharacterized protein n=1 Tax=Herpetosiphon geysericola TaxID=70996 RepID=A0A0N8GSB3_9CHLR|nr:hypothetical protein [Herpetosiphon geysericola]KPL88818.1 hypothetical protein SE18_09045 [Herpetosiphon geysericola]